MNITREYEDGAKVRIEEIRSKLNIVESLIENDATDKIANIFWVSLQGDIEELERLSKSIYISKSAMYEAMYEATQNK